MNDGEKWSCCKCCALRVPEENAVAGYCAFCAKLRDQFAMAALSGIIVQERVVSKTTAEVEFWVADKMMAERSRG